MEDWFVNMAITPHISSYAVVSKKTKMFGQDIHVVGRICTVHNSVNATSTTSNDALFEEFTLNFEGNITIIEICPLNSTTISKSWTFAYQAKLKLPLVCSIQSKNINCDAIKFQSSKVKKSKSQKVKKSKKSKK